METFVAHSLEESEGFAKEFLQKIAETEPQDRATVVGLSGELGSGKTNFVQNIAKLLGIDDIVTSPTFVIIKSYNISHERFAKLFHIDAYRLKSGSDLIPLAWESIVENQKHLIFIEWPEYVVEVLPPQRISIYFESIDESTRSMRVEGA